MRASRLALLVASLPLPAAAQSTFETGGGVARLDQLGTGPIAVATLRSDALFGPVRARLLGHTVNYQDRGVTGQVAARLQGQVSRDGWEIRGGPLFEAGNGIDEAWTHAYGVGVRVDKSSGPLTLTAQWDQGVALPGQQRTNWLRRVARGELAVGPFVVGASWQLTTLRDSVLRDNVFYDPRMLDAARADTLFRQRVRDMNDVGFMLAWNHRLVDINAELGRRNGSDIATSGWWRISGSLRVSQTASIILSTNRAPADLVLGLRGIRTSTLGLRLALPEIGTPMPEAVRRHPPQVEFRRTNDGLVQIFFLLPPGAQVRMMGEPTGWLPVSMERTRDGRWTTWLEVGPGIYRINISIDDGPWVVPPGIPAIADGFDGLVGLLDL